MISPFWLMRHSAMGLGGLSVAALLVLASGAFIDYHKSKDRTYKGQRRVAKKVKTTLLS